MRPNQQRATRKIPYSKLHDEKETRTQPPYFDDTEAHIHIWKYASVINGGDEPIVIKFEQKADSPFVDNRHPVNPKKQYCSVCHCARPPVFKMKSVDERDAAIEKDWCYLYNMETVRLENQRVMSIRPAREKSAWEKETDGIRQELCKSYWDDIPGLWKSGKYELAQIYIRRMQDLGDPGALQHKVQAENKLWNIPAKRHHIIDWYKERAGHDAWFGATLEKAREINKTPIYPPRVGDFAKMFTVDNSTITSYTELTGLNAEQKDMVMELRKEVRETMMTDVGELCEPTNTSRSIMKGASQNRPGKRIRPSIFLPKSTCVKVTRVSSEVTNPFESGMVIVVKKQSVTPRPSNRLVHEAAKFRLERKVRVNFIEEEQKLLEVA